MTLADMLGQAVHAAFPYFLITYQLGQVVVKKALSHLQRLLPSTVCIIYGKV